MKHLIQKLKSAMMILLLVITSVPLSSLTTLAAVGSVQNPAPVMLADGTVLKKTVEPVPGMINKWKVTLRVEAEKSQKTSDTILVIDRSGSMNNDSRLAKAKEAANNLIDSLLTTGNTTNRVAVLSFASESSLNISFTNDNDTAKAAVNSLSATGGTFTQAGMRRARELINSSTADIRNIILLSDGEPTYCYEVSYDWRMDTANLIPYSYLGWQTPTTVPESKFNSYRVGAGNSMYQQYDDSFGTSNDKYYNCGNHAIAEAGFYKTAGVGNLYTIALEAGANGDAVLNSMATPGKSYTATPAQLNTIFNEIAGEIKSAVQNATVNDLMGNGVVAVSTGENSNLTDGGKKLIWNLGTPTQQEGDKFVAELSYEIELDQNILNATADADGFYPANAEAKITYNSNQTGLFPVPKIKPTFVKIKKELVGDSACQNCQFTVNLTNGNQVISRNLLPGEANTATIYEAMPVNATYTVSETAAKDANGVALSLNQYTTAFTPTTINAGTFGDDAVITVTNTLKTRSVMVRKAWIGKQAEAVTVKLKADGLAVGEAVLSANNNWQHEFTNMPAVNRYSGENIVYTLEEAQLTGYAEPAYSMDNDGALVVTNTYVPKKINFTGTKKWVNGTNFNSGLGVGVRPTIKLQLKQNGVNHSTPVEIANGTTAHTWTDLDETDIYGNLYTYTVDEVDVPDSYEKTFEQNGLVVVNTYKPAATEITVTKKWQGGSVILPPSIKVNLYRQVEGGVKEAVAENVEIFGLNDNWTKTWQLPATDEQGNQYTYSVEEVQIANFTPSYQGLEITNTYNPDVRKVTATKKWVNGPENHPDIWFQLYRQVAGGALEVVPNAEIRKITGKTTTWSNIAKTDSEGREYTFSVKEVDALGNDFVPENYEKSGEGTLTITNTYQQPLTDDEVVAIKLWDGGENFENERPTVQFELWRKNGTAGDGEKVVEATLVVNDQVNFGKQLKTDVNGVEYEYYVIETTELENYVKIERGLTVLNKFIPPTWNPGATKKWQGGSAVRPPFVTVNLYRQLDDGAVELVGSRNLDALNNWTTIWEGMPYTDETGTVYDYWLEEDSVLNFELGNIDYGSEVAILTNTYVSPVVDINVAKEWNDEFDTHEAVDIEILRNGEVFEAVTLSERNDWSVYLRAVEATDEEGNPYVYSVRELTNLANYTTEISQKYHVEDNSLSFVITNTYVKPKVPMTGSGSHYLIMLALGGLMIMLGFATRRLAKQVA